jgi:hypothetical protein
MSPSLLVSVVPVAGPVLADPVAASFVCRWLLGAM